MNMSRNWLQVVHYLVLLFKVKNNHVPNYMNLYNRTPVQARRLCLSSGFTLTTHSSFCNDAIRTHEILLSIGYYYNAIQLRCKKCSADSISKFMNDREHLPAYLHFCIIK